MKLLKNRESGQALVMALILLALGGLLIVPMLNLSFTNLKYHQLIEGKTFEAYSADSGMQYALCELYNNPGGYTDPENPELNFPINDRAVRVTVDYQGGGIYKITSTATSANGRSTTIEAYINLSAGSFAYVVAAKESMTINKATVDVDEPGEQANIHSNGDIVLSNSMIYGNASAVNSIVGEECVINGMVICPSSAITFPGDYSELYRTMAQEGDNYTQDVTLTGGTPEDPITFGPAYIDGNLTVEPHTFVELTGTVYVTKAIFLKPHTRLEGEENILAEQDITIEGSEYVCQRIPVVTSSGGNIVCKGHKGAEMVHAVVYAPNGSVTLESAADLHGAVGGIMVVVQPGCQIIYAAELHGRQDVPGGELATITYSFR